MPDTVCVTKIPIITMRKNVMHNTGLVIIHKDSYFEMYVHMDRWR